MNGPDKNLKDGEPIKKIHVTTTTNTYPHVHMIGTNQIQMALLRLCDAYNSVVVKHPELYFSLTYVQYLHLLLCSKI